MITKQDRQLIEELFEELIDEYIEICNFSTLEMEHYFHKKLKRILDEMENNSD